MSRKTKHRKDGNHDDVKAALEAMGYLVLDTSQTNLGFDMICVKHGAARFVEVKDGSLPPSRQKLTPHEQKVHQQLRARGVTVELLTGVDQSLDVLGEKTRNYYKP